MAFVFEKITEAGREIFNSFDLKCPINGRPLEETMWARDRERDAFLIALGGDGEYGSDLPMFYMLIWNNNRIKVDAFSSGNGDISNGVEMFWKITKIQAPKCLLEVKDEMIEIITEGIASEGFAGRCEWTKSVQFDYIAAPEFMLEVYSH
ncbi:hypothetical protein PAECIP111893_02240 [Paenibacillus plantiphilus]|uniref:Uncharacterized protein n=1 Tax=Paenibacillus plantiphilus TaxID=2905650 RepID=A0ABM9C757_9BACL|nr:hypothetical protein [Paenibacillus plantiphilus]CAH1204388.1 hypothetical protein PAECIP111893_02240 [Paenibacillus plantiphilus]